MRTATRHSWQAPRKTVKSSGCRCPDMADIVAKVPKGAAANFPPKNETSDNHRSIGLQTRYQNRPVSLALGDVVPHTIIHIQSLETDGTAMASKSEAAPMASDSYPVISVLPRDRANPFFIVTQTAADTITRSEDKRRGQTHGRIQDRRGSCRLHGRNPARQREQAAC